MSEAAKAQIDPLLLPFLQAGSEDEADAVLAHLISEHAEPVVKNIVGYKFRVFFRESNRGQNNDAEDVRSEAMVDLLARLSELRSNPQLEGIRNFRSYVAVTTYRACYAHLRSKYPQRYSLKNKLRYFLTHQHGFALWQTEDEEWLAGLIGWEKESLREARSNQAQRLHDDIRAFEQASFSGGTASGASLNQLLEAIFEWTGHSIELDELVGIVAQAWKIKDHQVENEIGEGETADPRISIAKDVDRRIYLQKLWGEITQMSSRNCAALLLNLKDDQRASAIDLFLITGVASFKEIADALDRSQQWLSEIWNYLPIDDAAIARQLGITRQQVINLRKSARLRLAKRMSDRGFSNW